MLIFNDESSIHYYSDIHKVIILGNIKLPGPLMLAPIAGFTDSPFRRVARRHGAGLTVTELISAEGIIRHHRKTMELARFHEEERPIAIQLFGNKPDLMAEAAGVVGEILRPDIIDINLGCPARRICNSGSGAALLLVPEKVRAIASAMVQRVEIPVTAKIRIGWDSDSLTYRDIIRALEDGGVSLIFVHGRTRAQQYGGTSDWDIIRELVSISKVPVIGNGDIRTHPDAFERMKFSSCPAVMIGRGAIGNPWIFSGYQPSIRQVVDQINEHLDMMIEYYGERGIVLMRKHIVKYLHAFNGARHARQQVVIAKSKDEVNCILELLVNLGDDSNVI